MNKTTTQDPKTIKKTLARLHRDRKILRKQIDGLTKDLEEVQQDIVAIEKQLAGK